MARQGLIHIYTGQGKGKTSAAVGLSVRASGAGLKVLFVQFLKGSPTSELSPLRQIGVQVLRCEETAKFVFQMNEKEKAQYREQQQALFVQAAEQCAKGQADVLVLDEVMGALATDMLELSSLCLFLDQKPEQLEVVLTGRDAPEALISRAQYVSCLDCLKHPFEEGIPARKGIEF